MNGLFSRIMQIARASAGVQTDAEALHTLDTSESAAEAFERQLRAARLLAAESGEQKQRTVFLRFTFVEFVSLLLLAIGATGGMIVLLGDFSDEIKGAVVTLILIGGFTDVRSFWLGSSQGSREKDSRHTHSIPPI